MAPEVVITGLGTVHAAGVGMDRLAGWLSDPQPRLTAVDRSEGLHRKGSATLAALVGPLDTTRWIPPMIARRMSPQSRLAVVAARDAIVQAGLSVPEDRTPSLSVTMSSAFGPMSYTQRLLDQAADEGADCMSPSLFTESVANAPAAQVAIQLRACGPNHTICQKEAGPLIAAGRGAAQIRAGQASRALVGSVEEMTPLVHAVLDRFRALASANDDASETARPFDRRRNGFVAADGATVLVLEEQQAADDRDANVLARLRGWGSAFDPTASSVGWGRSPDGLARGLGRFLRRCDVSHDSIDMIVSGASGSIAGDRLEALVLKRVWGESELPPILVPKACCGEYGGGFLAAAVLAASGFPFGANPGSFETDPELGIVPHDGRTLNDPRRILVSTLGAGGSVAWLLLERP